MINLFAAAALAVVWMIFPPKHRAQHFLILFAIVLNVGAFIYTVS